MRKTNKFLALGLAASLVVSALAGCGGSSGTSADTAAGTAAGNEAAAESADAGKSASSGDKLLVGLTQSSMVTDYENNYFTNYLEEQLGFELEFYMLPADAAETRTKLR